MKTMLPKQLLYVFLFVLLTGIVNKTNAQFSAGTWSQMPGSDTLNLWSGNSYQTNGICRDRAGNLYIIGQFATKLQNSYVAKFDGTTWSELGGIESFGAISNGGTIAQICIDKLDNIYVVGSFSQKTNGYAFVAKFDAQSQTWGELGGAGSFNAYDYVRCIYADAQNNIYVGGDIYNNNGNRYVAKYTAGTNTWSEMSVDNQYDFNGSILCITGDDNSNIYVSGQFFYSDANNTYNTQVLKYNQSTDRWNPIPGLVSPIMGTMCTDHSGNLFVVDMHFPDNGYNDGFYYVEKYDGTSWTTLGGNGWWGYGYGGQMGYIEKMMVDDQNDLIIAGGQTDIAVNPAMVINKFNYSTNKWILSSRSFYTTSSVFFDFCLDATNNVYLVGVNVDATMGVIKYNYNCATSSTTNISTCNSSYSWNSTTYNSSGTYTIHLTNASGCDSAATLILTLNAAPAWTGAVSTDWNTAGNWSCGTVPGIYADVNIPVVSSGNYPVLAHGRTRVNNIIIASGASVSLNDNTLVIAGALTGTGVIKGSSASILAFNTTENNTVYFGSGATDTLIGTFILDNTGIVKLGSGIGITKLLSITNSGAVLDINGHHLTLKSTATQTAEVGPMATGAVITDNTQAGLFTANNITVERYIPKGLRNYRDLGPSVAGGSVFDNWQEAGAGSPSYTYGVYVTGNTGAPGYSSYDPASGFDYTSNGIHNPSLYTCPNASWKAANVTNGGTKGLILDPFKGYRLIIRGSRNFNMGTNPSSMPTATTLRAKGVLVYGSVGFYSIENGGTVADNYASSYGLTNGGGWSFIANPYACPVSWASILATNASNTYLNSTFYFLDATYQNNGFQRYVTVQYNGSSVNVVNRPSGVSTDEACLNIQAGQGFWIYHDPTSTPFFAIQESDKIVGVNQNAVFGTNTANKLNISIWKDVDGISTNIDGAVATFNNNFSKSIGKEDAKKIMNSGENISITESINNLSIDGLTLPTVGEEIALRISNVAANTTYKLNVDVADFAVPGVKAFIKDAYLNKEVPATTVVSFTPTSDVNTYKDRFSVVFKAEKVVPVATGNGKINVYPNPVTEKSFTIQMQNIAAGKYKLALINNLGQEVMNTAITHAEGALTETVKMNKFINGLYTVILRNADGKSVYQTELLAK